MPRRIELELTSERPNGSWTWRAAGAREPKGELDGAILPTGVKVGDVLRAEAEFDIEGITVLSVLPPKGARQEPERLEVLGPQREFTPVTSTLVGKGERRGGPRRDRPDGGPRGDRPDRGPRAPGRDGDRSGDIRERRPRAAGEQRGERPPRRARPAPPPPKPKPKKLHPGKARRDALLQVLSPEQVPVAEQLFRGGMPGVRQALEEQNANARAENLPEIPEATIMAIAEDLLPRVRVADWLDRAEAARADAELISLRDLRAVVTSADDVARDESTRELAAELKEVLDRRSGAEQTEWLSDLKASLDGSRVVRALRLSSRPPQPGESIPEELTTRLTEAANAAMTADIAPDRWGTLLDAVAYSPVRRTIAPAGIPPEPGDELLALVKKHAGRVPSIATLFGVEPPPPPGAKRQRTPRPKPVPQKMSRPPLPPLPSGERRIPPPPGRPLPPPPPAPETQEPPPATRHGEVLPAEPAEAAEDVPEPAQAQDMPEPAHGEVPPAEAAEDVPEPAQAQDMPATPAPSPEPQPSSPHGDVLSAEAPQVGNEVEQA